MVMIIIIIINLVCGSNNKVDEIYFETIFTKKQADIMNNAIRQSSWKSINFSSLEELTFFYLYLQISRLFFFLECLIF
jgi:hypothetical protein